MGAVASGADSAGKTAARSAVSALDGQKIADQEAAETLANAEVVGSARRRVKVEVEIAGAQGVAEAPVAAGTADDLVVEWPVVDSIALDSTATDLVSTACSAVSDSGDSVAIYMVAGHSVNAAQIVVFGKKMNGLGIVTWSIASGSNLRVVGIALAAVGPAASRCYSSLAVDTALALQPVSVPETSSPARIVAQECHSGSRRARCSGRSDRKASWAMYDIQYEYIRCRASPGPYIHLIADIQ